MRMLLRRRLPAQAGMSPTLPRRPVFYDIAQRRSSHVVTVLRCMSTTFGRYWRGSRGPCTSTSNRDLLTSQHYKAEHGVKNINPQRIQAHLDNLWSQQDVSGTSQRVYSCEKCGQDYATKVELKTVRPLFCINIL
jgi:hypothetical protein